MGFPGGQPANAGEVGSISGLGRLPWRRKGQPPPRVLAWEISWTEEPGGLQSTGSQEVGMTEQVHTHAQAEHKSRGACKRTELKQKRSAYVRRWVYLEIKTGERPM